MAGIRFDALARSFARGLSRRAVLGAVSLAAASPARAARRTTRLKRNEFGGVNVGGACRGKDGACCSGICRGKKPKQGKKDRSRCAAQDEGGCRAGAQTPACGGTAEPCTTSSGASGLCGTTTGKAGFCSQGFICSSCTRDEQCQPSPDPKAACIRCATCAGGTACAAP